MVPIPQELCDVALFTVNNTEPVFSSNHYAWFNCPEELETYVLKNVFSHLPGKFRVQLQAIKNGIGIHTDTGREMAYNYLILDGYDGMYSPINLFFEYNEETGFNAIETVHHIKAHKWHKLNTSVFHTVINFYSDRVAITVSPINDELV